MRRRVVSRLGLLSVIALVPSIAGAQNAVAIEARTAATHPMRYLVSLPNGWNADRQWPVLVVITDANRHFEGTTGTFAAARGNLPFVIITPLVLSGGGTAQQHMGDFDYGADAWARAAADGNCQFDEDGLTAVLADARQRYHTEDRVFMTGWEAGGHVVLAQVLDHPERVRAAAVATPNFIGRCLNPNARSHEASALGLPLRVLHGSADSAAWAPSRPLYQQWLRLDSLTRAREFTNVKDILAPNRDHGPLAVETFAFFSTFISR